MYGRNRVENIHIPHCSRKVRVDETWFLRDNENFCRRRFYIVYECPVCRHRVGYLVEIDRNTKKRHSRYYKEKTGELAKKEYELISQVVYTSRDRIPSKGSTYGLCYGDYKEDVKNGKITEYKRDFYGNFEKKVILT